MDAKSFGIGELAEYSGIKYDTVYSLVRGRRVNTSADTLRRIAMALETSIDYLLGDIDEEGPPVQTMPESIRRIAEMAANLSEMRRGELLHITAALVALELGQRDRTSPPLSSDDRSKLLTIAEQLRENLGDNDLLDALEALLRNPPSAGGLDDSQLPDDPG